MNFMKLNKTRGTVLDLSQGDPRHECRLGNSPAEKELGMLVNDKMKMSQQCALSAHKANSIQRSLTRRQREVILHLYSIRVRNLL